MTCHQESPELCRQLGRQVSMVYNNLNWDAAASSLQRALSVSFASRYIQLTKVTS